MFEEIYYKELAHKIREIEKSHDLPMTSSRLRNACGVIQSECKGLRNRREDDNPLQYSFLENPIDREAWWATVHGVAKE